MHILISNRGGVPIYEQIKEQIKSAIFSGELKEGAMLPSIRQLARDLKISVITTTRAYNDLEQEGFVATMPGKGCFVLPQNTELAREQKLREIEQHLLAAIAAAGMIRVSEGELAHMLHTLCEEVNHESRD